MRTYPRNSPQAAARIVSLAMLADGNLCKSELDMLDRMEAFDELGLSRAEMNAVVRVFCEELLAASHHEWSQACRIDPRTLDEMMAEIDDPALREKVLNLCVAVVEADGHVAEGESIVVTAAVEQWGLHRRMFDAAPGAGAASR